MQGVETGQTGVPPRGGMWNISARKLRVVSYGGVTALACVLMWWNHTTTSASLELAEKRFAAVSHQAAKDRADAVSADFRELYEGLRTIARLPGVRSVDRYAEYFDADARATVQEIYNNLATSLALSEVYIVPLDMRPDELDPVTGEAQEPITTFDELIVGRTAGDDEAREPSEDRPVSDGSEKVEEIEIFEYRLMRRQMDWLSERFPHESMIKGLAYPALSGPEVVTCDNSRYSAKAPDDSDRSGVVYSVPFYGPDGALRGMISGVVLTHAIRDHFTNGDSALCIPAHRLTVLPRAAGSAREHAAEVERGTEAPGLGFCEVIPLSVNDAQGEWRLWSGRPVAALHESLAYKSARRAGLTADAGILAVTSAMLAVVWLLDRSVRASRRRSRELETLVGERTVELESARRRAEDASRTKSEFLANMSHEIRTPMTAILGFTDILFEDAEVASSTVRRRETLATIKRSGEHLLAIINDILDASKIEAGKMAVEAVPTDPAQIVEDVVSLLRVKASARGLRLERAYQGPVPRQFACDPVRLRQVLVNLVGNAVKFTESWSVVLRAWYEPGEGGGAGVMRFEIEDTGIGMTAQEQGRLFKAFGQADTTVTRRFGGTGLGLTISRCIAELLGGTVTVRSEPGKGSVFTATVRVSDAAGVELWTPTAQAREAERSAGSGHEGGAARPLSGVRVLLAEDGEDNRRLLTFHLKSAGALVTVVENGRLAVEALTIKGDTVSPARDPAPFDVILMDMQMPEMDGYSAARRLRSLGCRVPVVALTAHAMTGDRLKCVRAGCDDYATKPIDKDELLRTCARWASARHAPAAESRDVCPGA